MGLGCSRAKQQQGDGGPDVVRLSPFRRTSRRALGACAAADGAGPPPLLALALDVLVRGLHQQRAGALSVLPPDLSQLLLDELVGRALLDGAAVARLAGQGLHFFRLPLGACHEPVRPAWLRCLATPSLQDADLSKTEGIDDALACLGSTPHLTRLCLDFCVDLSDAGLALLQGVTSLRELSLAGCELVTSVGVQHLATLTGLRRLNVQTCHQISLAPLSTLRQLEQLDAGWCSNLGDADALVLSCLSTSLTRLSLARTQLSDDGLAHLRRLRQLRCLNVAGTRVSDEALAALLRCLPLLESLNLERCMLAGDACLAALGEHARQLRELQLGYTVVSDAGLRHLGSMAQLESLSLENCAVGDTGLAVLGSLTAMRELDLSDTRASNECMGGVAAMHRLQRLDLSFTGVDDAGLRPLRRLSSLRCLSLDSRLFTDGGIARLAHLTGLECLDLFGARISDAGCASISKMSNLRRLEVCGGGVTDAGVAHLAATLTRLQHLSLAQNYRVSNSSVPHLIRLNELQALNLSQCRVTSHSVVALGCLPRLQTLALHETRVKPFAVDKLLAANPDLCVQGVVGTAQAAA